MTPVMSEAMHRSLGSPISPAVSTGKTRLWRFFRPSRFHLTGSQQPRALLFQVFRMRMKNALQSPIEIKADSIVFDNLVVGPWHR